MPAGYRPSPLWLGTYSLTEEQAFELTNPENREVAEKLTLTGALEGVD